MNDNAINYLGPVSHNLFDKWLHQYGTEGWRVCIEANPNSIPSQEILQKLHEICIERAKELAALGDETFKVFGS